MKLLTIGGLVIGTTIGLAMGVGGYTFYYAKGASYLTNNAAACANCHIMQQQYDGWTHSSHHAVASCNDCHTPPGIIPKYATKASNGFWHSFAFTTGKFHEPIRIGRFNRAVAESACRKCHGDVVHDIEGMNKGGEKLSCIHCHGSVGHPK
jgi:cytochrome c nitrite reductase small subunit